MKARNSKKEQTVNMEYSINKREDKVTLKNSKGALNESYKSCNNFNHFDFLC